MQRVAILLLIFFGICILFFCPPAPSAAGPGHRDDVFHRSAQPAHNHSILPATQGQV